MSYPVFFMTFYPFLFSSTMAMTVKQISAVMTMPFMAYTSRAFSLSSTSGSLSSGMAETRLA